VKRSLRRERDGLIADLQAYKRAKMEDADRTAARLILCGLCRRPIPERSLSALDGRPFHTGCANRVLRDEMAALGKFTELAIRHTAALVDRRFVSFARGGPCAANYRLE
jgi:hypothetical protein